MFSTRRSNPLTSDAQHILFSEPKSTRKLSVASISLVNLPNTIEMPFLKSLNLSENKITQLKASSFERTSLLQVLDLSHNKLANLNTNGVWRKLASLRKLYLANNPVQFVTKVDFDVLTNLETLDISRLPQLTHLECDVLGRLSKLKELMIYGYPSLTYLESQECLQHVSAHLEKLAIEIKEPFLQGHLQRAFSPRITELTISGGKLSHLSPSTLNGIRAPRLTLKLMNTSVSNIPAHIFSPLPLSTHVDLQLQRNEIGALDGQLVNALDSKQMSVKINGLKVVCDCKLEPLWRWVNERIKLSPNVKYYNAIDANLTCSSPKRLAGMKLADLDVEQLACAGDGNLKQKAATTTPSTSTTKMSATKGTYTEFRVDAAESVNVLNHAPISTRRASNQHVISHLNRGHNRNKVYNGVTTPPAETKHSKLTKVDTMIIGIVAGVVAFVCILILIVCVVRLKSSSYEHHHPHGMCTCKSGPCHVVPPPASVA